MMKFISRFLSVMICVCMLAACGEATHAQSQDDMVAPSEKAAPVSVVTSDDVSENGQDNIQDNIQENIQGDIMDDTWVLQSLNQTDLVETTKITLVLGKDGSLSGNAGCNGYRGHYEFVADKDLKVNPAIVSTMRACAEDVMKQEYAYHQILGEVVSWDMTSAQELLLKTGDGKVLLFTRK